MKLSLQNGTGGITTIFHVIGTGIIRSKKENLKKENDYEYLCGKLIL